MFRKKVISIVTPCYNESENVAEVHSEIKRVFEKLPGYRYELIFIDNFSTDGTIEVLRDLAKADKDVKVIVNIKNFGHIRSPHYAVLQSTGDAVVYYYANLKDPADLIVEFVRKWEEGYKIVIGIKKESQENKLMFLVRKIYYRLIRMISETDHIDSFTGYGLYDRSFIDILRKFNEPYPYFRGMVAEFGYNRVEIPFYQSIRKKGKSKNNFYTLYDNAMLGFVNHSKVPIRLASFIGFSLASLSLLIAVIYLLYKLLFWNQFQVGTAPMVIGLFFFSSVQLFFIGIIGEYIGAIYTQVKNRPLVIEKERINF